MKEWKIPNEAMSASSSLGTNYAPWMGRLGAKVGGGAWCAKSNNNSQYLQIDLGHVNRVRSIGIQGKEGVSRHPTLESAWVKNFTVSHSIDGVRWTDHEEHGVSKVCFICLFPYCFLLGHPGFNPNSGQHCDMRLLWTL